MLGLRRIARAIAVRCFCPPERVIPRSPTTVRYCSGKALDVRRDVRRFGGGTNLRIGRFIFPERNVLANGFTEKERFLRNKSD